VSRPLDLWAMRGWLLLSFAALVLGMTVLTVRTEHGWHGLLLVWTLAVCAVGALTTTIATYALTGLPGEDETVRRVQRRNLGMRNAEWIGGGLVAGWLAALRDWSWIVGALTVYVVLNAVAFAALYYARRGKATTG
jgi:hypothetical protein